MTAAFFVLLTFFVHGEMKTAHMTCPDKECVERAISISRRYGSAFVEARVYDQEPVQFGSGDIYTPALSDYRGA